MMLRSGIPCLGLLLFLALSLLAGCGDWKVDPAGLTARTGTGATDTPGPSCSSCHAFALTDINHTYHLEKAVGNRNLNGAITCLDCHSQSLRSQAITLFDSVYEDVTGEQWRTLSHPNAGDTTPEGKVIRNMTFLSVDTLPQHHPVPAPVRAGAEVKAGYREYITGLAHMNGRVDVVFDSRNSRPSKFNGDSASFNPTQETCSAVACHPGTKPYRWGAPSKGLPEWKDDDEEAAAP